jgi:hypothetical protein
MGATDQAATEEITRLEFARAEAYLRRDIPALERLLPEHFTFNRSIGSFGKRELLTLIESGQLTFESLERRVESVKVYLATAVAFGMDVVKVRYRGEDIGGRYRFSNTYVWDGVRWVIVVTHSSRIP